MRTPETNEDAEALALRALIWVLGDDDRSNRLMTLTGLDPDDLRSRLTDPSVLDAVLEFLEGYEPDLIACAQHLGIGPEKLIRARQELSV
jgi:hypothetical protein